MNEFTKKYDFKYSEQKWQEFWNKNEIYKWNKEEPRENNYVIDTPPPTVSGQLHIGHVYSYCQTDIIARYKRMRGYNVFYTIGFDDNGLPTERLVEKKKKIKASQLPREEFIKICQQVVEEEESKFRALFKSIALSVDWNLEYQTISPASRTISQMSFLDLIRKNQAYRDSQPILWDPVDQTALAQADIEDKQRDSFMNDIAFELEDGGQIIIATTRPELLPACVSVFFHPDDKRHNHLKEKFAYSPLFGVKVPLLPDELVDPEKGTGLVMCCTFGDQTDVIWWRKHDLPCKIIVNKYGKIDHISFDKNCRNINKAKEFALQINGLKVEDARKVVIELLRDEGALLDQTPIVQTVKCAERSGAPLEIITTPQWFIKAIEHKQDLLKRSAELKWFPKSMKIKLDTWIDNVSLDWCISRQRFFGVPIPVWYSKRSGEEGMPIFPEIQDLPIDPIVDLPKGYSAHEVEPDIDVMDTWSTSAVTPQLNSLQITNEFYIDQEKHSKLFPFDLRPQAHEIIRTWAFYTLLKSHLHENTLPWKNIMVSGWCLAEDKSKMSKSKGNVIVPEVILDQYGSDVIRYWTASSKLGADTVYSEDVLNNGKRTVNKLWNAAKFVSQHFNKMDASLKSKNLDELSEFITADFDKYFVYRLKTTVKKASDLLDDYEYAHAALNIEQFFWSEFCDNYLEISKTRAYNEDGSNNQGQLSAIITLYYSLNYILKLYAPLMPHITEELYQILYSQGESIHQRANWPVFEMQISEDDRHNKKLISECTILLEILDLVRKAKADRNISVKAPIDVLEIYGINTLSASNAEDLRNVTSSQTLMFLSELNMDTSIDGKTVSINPIFVMQK